MSMTHSAVEIGSPAPDFRLPSNRGEVALSDYCGKKRVLLYFIREFGCLTCQFHAAALVKAYPQIEAAGCEVLVIGGGNEIDAVKMAHRLTAPFPILADGDRSVYERYNVDKVFAFLQRSATFIIDVDGRIAYAHRSANPSAGLNIGEVLAALGGDRTTIS
jgi:peroxiredoxin Q/BCP